MVSLVILVVLSSLVQQELSKQANTPIAGSHRRLWTFATLETLPRWQHVSKKSSNACFINPISLRYDDFILQMRINRKVGFAIVCYQCNSHNDSRCLLEKLPDSLRLPCPETKHTMCRKISQVVEFEMNGMPPDSRVIRGCGWDESNYKGRCYQRSGFGGRQEVCSCLEDGCNSASIPVGATALMLIAFALLRL